MESIKPQIYMGGGRPSAHRMSASRAHPPIAHNTVALAWSLVSLDFSFPIWRCFWVILSIDDRLVEHGQVAIGRTFLSRDRLADCHRASWPVEVGTWAVKFSRGTRESS